MARQHRSLTTTKFVSVVDPDYLRRYIADLDFNTPPSAWAEINGEEFDKYLSRRENQTIAAIVREDFQRVNDVCSDGMNLILRAYRRAGIAVDQELTAEDLAFRLFLDNRKAFDFAWSRYLLFAGTAKLSVHAATAKTVDFSEGSIRSFERGLSVWFSDQAKGQQCEITHFDDGSESILLIRHGTYLRAFPHWLEDQLAVAALRPALEDLIVFEREKGVLRIRASGQKERREYIRLFALHVLGDEELAKQAESEEVFTLSPIQSDQFSYAGAGPITRVQLRHVKMRLYGVTEPIINISSPDVAISFEHDMQGLSLENGLLLSAKLKFHIQYPGERPTSRTFTISPPSRSDLPDRRDRDLVMGYLEDQGVVLR